MKKIRKHGLFAVAFAAVVLAAVAFRGAGLWHGLGQDYIHHPDSPKQVQRLEGYLQGHYVHHVDNLFYDGYPYGLNRLDEGLVRILARGSAAWRSWLGGPGAPAVPPDHVSLYRWGRGLRLFYGVLAALLVYASARRWGAGRWAALAGAALYAAAPLAVTVAHSVTGDVGVDLFVAAALYAASAQAVTARAAWWVAFGAACGAGFACKFQGALAAWMAVPPLLAGLRDGWRGWRRLPGAGLLAAAGFVGAVALLNPALALDTTRAWRDTCRNFGFIQDYGVPPERLAWPFGKKVAWGLTHNVPFVAGCLGWGMVALSLASAGLLAATAWRPAFASLRVRRAAGTPAQTPEERGEAETSARCARWLLGIATFPWLAFLLAAALKLEIQPFHFTFLLPPMALSVALAVSWWTEPPDGAPRPLAAAVAALLVAAALAVAVHGTSREMFFWRRPDVRTLAMEQSEAVFGDARWGAGRRGVRRWIKRFYAEPATLPCFRNAESFLSCPPGAWREGQMLLPVPAVPQPSGAGDGWIFLGGPVFPRSDRMFTVPATGNGHRAPVAAAAGSPLFIDTLSPRGDWTERILVFPAPPRKLVVGLRTGRLPARCEISTSLLDTPPKRLLAPESQTLVELPQPEPVYAFPADEAAGRPAVWACRLRVRAQLGPVWVSVLGSPEEAGLYALHGPRAAARPDSGNGDGAGDSAVGGSPDEAPAAHPAAADPGLYAGEMERLRYLDSDVPFALPETAAVLPPPIPGAGPGLAAGPYRFLARVRSPAPATVTLLLSGSNATDAPEILCSGTIPVAAGEQEIEWSFSKPFAPYGATLRASADVPGATLLSWTLKPDPGALAVSGWEPPAPAEPAFPGGIGPGDIPVTPLGISYAHIATFLDVRIPDSWHVSDSIPYAVSLRLAPDISHKVFGELAIFLHLENEEGEVAGALDYSFADASFEGGPLRWKLSVKAFSPPPGTYTLRAGLFNGHHGGKFAYAPHRRIFDVKTVTVLPD